MKYAALAASLALTFGCVRTSDFSDPAFVNRVHRSYDKPPDEIWRAIVATLKEYDLKVDKEENDGLGGRAVARRANKDRVMVESRSLSATTSDVSIAVDPGDRNMAEILLNRLSEKLGVATAATGFRGAPSVEGLYNQPLEICMSAAVKAAEALKMTPTHKEVHDTWARVDARQSDAIPVQIRIERTPKDQTRVTFFAGTSRSEDTQALASRLKVEFERALPTAD